MVPTSSGPASRAMNICPWLGNPPCANDGGVKKGTDFYITFRFPDGSEKEFLVEKKRYDSTEIGTEGILIYKERKDKSHSYLIRFEKGVF